MEKGKMLKKLSDLCRRFDPLTLLSIVLLGIIVIFCSEVYYHVSWGQIMILEGIQVAFVLNPASYFAPVLVCLPGVMRMYEERLNGYDTLHRIRIGGRDYARRKLLHAMGEGLRVMLGALLIYTLYAVILAIGHGLPLTFQTEMIGNEYDPNFNYRLLQSGLGVVVYLLNMGFLCGYAMFWNIVGTVASIFVLNRRVAIATPFLIRRLTDYMFAAEQENAWFYFRPANLLMSWTNHLPLGGFWYGILYVWIAFYLGWLIIYAKLWREER